MAVAVLKDGKRLRRLVGIRHQAARLPVVVELSDTGLRFRRPDAQGRQHLEVRWEEVLGNARDPAKGYRVWSIAEAYSHLGDVTADPHACPCCGERKGKRRRR